LGLISFGLGLASLWRSGNLPEWTIEVARGHCECSGDCSAPKGPQNNEVRLTAHSDRATGTESS
jgi:hypothetical protein